MSFSNSMFTGLIEATGTIERREARAAGQALRCATPLGAELAPGDSIAVSGVCLTVVAADARGFDVEVSPETLRVTTLGALAPGGVVNLERPLRADSRLGGHFVLGHVDAVGRLAGIKDEGDHHWLDVEFPAAFAPSLISKGSVAVDGISLTVAALDDGRFGVQIVPFTWSHTALHVRRPGDTVNLEGDVIGKYVARLYAAGLAPETARKGPS
jgi:riboflavin synthase